ncbi:MAG: hypothetical protein DCF17_05645 [Shackletoniella antarctica]|uniref:DUF11 domain-containing protein n=1 Tax=Shackletoniella antarctica TaxID=268115 RepID=A0A2W4YKW9_9CYAN|nr:MAG: hypothetical protein DCF17_05645 [Shackletoniella antarctica]
MFALFQSCLRPLLPLPLARALRLTVCLLFVAASLTGWASPSWAQLITPPGSQPVTAINPVVEAAGGAGPTLTPFAAPCDNGGTLAGCTGQQANLSYQGQNRRLTTFAAGGQTYERVVIPGETVVFRRAGVPAGLPAALPRDILFFEGGQEGTVVPNQPISLLPSIVPPTQTVEQVMLSPFINRGIDNVFANAFANVFAGAADQDTRNNVRRIDYISPAGITVPVAERDTQGFVVFERGGNDNFAIAAITAIDPFTQLPTAYGTLGRLQPGDWGRTNIGFTTLVQRREPIGTGPFRPSHVVVHDPANNQDQFISGIFFPVSSLVPNTQATIFGYSLFSDEVGLNPPADLRPFAGFPNAGDFTTGGLDLVAGGFGLFRVAQPQPPSFALLKRITNLFGVAPLPNFNQFVGDGAALILLQNNNLGQGLDVITDPAVQAGNGIEYTVYFANSGLGAAPNVVLCDQIPVGLTFAPNGYGPGLGIQAIAASSPPGPVVNYTNAADGDPGTFFAPGAALPPFCGTNQGNGAVVVNAANVAANQVGFIRFRTTVD